MWLEILYFGFLSEDFHRFAGSNRIQRSCGYCDFSATKVEQCQLHCLIFDLVFQRLILLFKVWFIWYWFPRWLIGTLFLICGSSNWTWRLIRGNFSNLVDSSWYIGYNIKRIFLKNFAPLVSKIWFTSSCQARRLSRVGQCFQRN